MRAYPVPFTGTGQVETSDSAVVGVAFSGFTSVSIYNGTDNTGDLAVFLNAPGSFGLNYELDLDKGCYVVVAGSGKGTLWLA